MEGPPKTALFLARASYRQRRLRDAALLVPVLGVILWIVPLLWSAAPDGAPTGRFAIVYIFGAWVLLIILTAFISKSLRQPDALHDADDGG